MTDRDWDDDGDYENAVEQAERTTRIGWEASPSPDTVSAWARQRRRLRVSVGPGRRAGGDAAGAGAWPG